ncbi:MAG: lysophospholipase [Myxococcales bacterium]|nr:lysophospholipase [Myxococcales bacterium]
MKAKAGRDDATIHREEGFVRTPDGLDLFWRSWIPAAAPKGVLLFVHGLGEHSGRYGNPVAHFAPRGWVCYAFDYRGHGKSPGGRVHVNAFDEYLSDLSTVHGLVRDRQRGRPVFVVGHSQGGLITLRYAIRHPRDLPGVVVSSPFLGVAPAARPSAALKAVAAVLSRVAPTIKFPNGVDPKLICRDKAVVDAYVNDPLVSNKVSARWFTEALGALDRAHAEAGMLRVPALVMQAGADGLVDPEATREWVSRAPERFVEYVGWEGLYHELFNEPERERVFERMDRWLGERLGGKN